MNTLQLVTLVGLFVSLSGSFFDLGIYSSRGQSEIKENLGVSCRVSSPSHRWKLRDTKTTISVEFELQGNVDVAVMPAVQLTALPKKANELDQDQYWAPFELESGSSTDKWQHLTNRDNKQLRSVRLAPSELYWARSRSSVWPSRPFAKLVPPGEYSLQVTLDTRDDKEIVSNEVVIDILK